MITERSLYLQTPPGPPSLPRITRLVWERASNERYRHPVIRRSECHAVVQITLAGQGGIFDDQGQVLRRCDLGQALIFITRQHHLTYGYAQDTTKPWDFLYANIEGTVANLIIEDLVRSHGHVVNLPREHGVISELLALVPEHSAAHRHIRAADNARLAFDILSALVEANAIEPSDEDRLVDQAKTFFQSRLEHSVGVSEAARHCQVSREHLSRCFTRLLGEGPATWLRRQRLIRAERFLIAGDMSIAEIASRCGFASASHFARSFRRHSGQEPRRYRST